MKEYGNMAKSKHRIDIEFWIEELNSGCVNRRRPVSLSVINPFGIVQAGAILWLANETTSVLVFENSDLSEDSKRFPLAVNQEYY